MNTPESRQGGFHFSFKDSDCWWGKKSQLGTTESLTPLKTCESSLSTEREQEAEDGSPLASEAF